MTPTELLRGWLDARLDDESGAWLRDRLAKVAAETDGDRQLYLGVGLAPRKLGKRDLDLTEAELAAADALRPGWWPGGWTIDQTARVLLLLSAPGDAERLATRLGQLCITSDVGEAMALYRGLTLYPEPERYVGRAAEGVRTNMKGVFESVAHHTPYAAAYLSEDAWNQMVLKAIFIGTKLHPMVGLDARANPALRDMLRDYAHERWAAGRDVYPELWRCVGPVADDGALDDLERAFDTDDETEREAVGLSLASCPAERAAKLLGAVPDLAARIERGDVRWQTVAAKL